MADRDTWGARVRLAIPCVAVVCLLASCSGSRCSESVNDAPPRLVCDDAASAEAFLASFFDAVRHGNLEAARAHLSANEESFEFLSDKLYRGPTGTSGDASQDIGFRYIEPQLASLIARGDTFTISDFGYYGTQARQDPRRGQIGNFAYTGIRETSDDSIRLVGKGVLDCSEEKIIALVMG